MQLVEKIQIRNNKKLSYLCHQSKSLYNLGLYYIDMNYDIFNKYLNWYNTKWMLKTSIPFRRLPSQVAQNTLKYLDKAWIGFFESLKDYKLWKSDSKRRKREPNRYKSVPQPPHYLRKNGEYIVCFNHQHIPKKRYLSKENIKRQLFFPKKANLEPIEIETCYSDLVQIRIVPKYDIHNLEIIYKKDLIDLELDLSRVIGIDIGVNNLGCTVNNIGLQPFTINGRPLKSINHFYNKEISKLQSEMSKKLHNECLKIFIGKIYKKNGKETKKFIDYINGRARNKLQQTPKMKKLGRIRYNKISDYIHKASRYIIDFCIENNIGMIVIGKNPLWKQKVNMGKRGNQNFVQIPFNILIEKIQYKADLLGIKVEVITEEYTSLCSFLDDEKIGFHKKYAGRRINRGLFKASDGRLINADVNGAYNILKKAFPEAISADGIKGAQLHPLRVNLDTKSRLTSIKIS